MVLAWIRSAFAAASPVGARTNPPGRCSPNPARGGAALTVQEV